MNWRHNFGMPTSRSSSEGECPLRGQFTTTHWSVVLEAGQRDSPTAAEALEQLCRTYWYPLYAYVRRKGHAVEEAEDLTQEFFSKLLISCLALFACRRTG